MNPAIHRAPLVALLLLAACPKAATAPANTALDRDSHATRFPIAQGAHATADCNDCHGAFESFSQFTCLTSSCHLQGATDASHAGIAGYGYDSKKCLACHPTGTASVDHVPFFPIAAGDKHNPVACADCHTDPATRTVTTCNLCHTHTATDMPAKHGAVNDFDPATAKCLRCHADSQVSRVALHLPFRIDASSAHHAAGCLQCHPAMRTDKPYGADFGPAAVQCLTCHDRATTDPKHSAVTGYSYDNARCLACHPNGAASVDHVLFFPIAVGDLHNPVACADCHTDSTTRAVTTCNLCHTHTATDMAPKHTLVNDFDPATAKCLRCHADSQVKRVALHTSFLIDPQSPHHAAGCLQCHPGLRSDKPYGADFGPAAVQCLTCHDRATTDPNHNGVSGYSYDNAKCLACHPTGLAQVNHVAFFPIAAGDKHNPVACADCHTNPATHTVTTCNVCHTHTSADMPAVHTSVGGFDTASDKCLRCHADSQVTRVAAHLPFRIDAQTRHFRTSCLACHPQLRADKPYGADFSLAKMDCLACHNGAEMADTHSGMPGYQYQSPSCIQAGGCHADGTKPGN